MFEFILILFELYFPSIFYKTTNISPDFLLLLILYISFKYTRVNVLVIAFLCGFIKDILISYSWFGLIALLVTIFAYMASHLKKINSVSINYIFSSLLIFFYFYFYFLFQFSYSFIFCLELSIVKTLMTILIYFVIKVIYSRSYNYFEK